MHAKLRGLVGDRLLRGLIAELHVLTATDYKELAQTCLDPEIWRTTIAKIRTESELRDYLVPGLERLAIGAAVPFAIRLVESGRAVGATRLSTTDDEDALEIGWTFLAPAWHRSGINAQAKLLLLQHAFDEAGCRRVVFKVAAGNDRSMSALAAIGAVPCAPERVPAHGRDPAVQWFELNAANWNDTRQSLTRRVERAMRSA